MSLIHIPVIGVTWRDDNLVRRFRLFRFVENRYKSTGVDRSQVHWETEDRFVRISLVDRSRQKSDSLRIVTSRQESTEVRSRATRRRTEWRSKFDKFISSAVVPWCCLGSDLDKFEQNWSSSSGEQCKTGSSDNQKGAEWKVSEWRIVHRSSGTFEQRTGGESTLECWLGNSRLEL